MSDWSSDVCPSDLDDIALVGGGPAREFDVVDAHRRVARRWLVVPHRIDGIVRYRHQFRALGRERAGEPPRPVDAVQPWVIADCLPRRDVRAQPFGDARLRYADIVIERPVDLIADRKST